MRLTESALARQVARGFADARAGLSFRQSCEGMSYAPGLDRRQARDGYERGWRDARAAKGL